MYQAPACLSLVLDLLTLSPPLPSLAFGQPLFENFNAIASVLKVRSQLTAPCLDLISLSFVCVSHHPVAPLLCNAVQGLGSYKVVSGTTGLEVTMTGYEVFEFLLGSQEDRDSAQLLDTDRNPKDQVGCTYSALLHFTPSPRSTSSLHWGNCAHPIPTHGPQIIALLPDDLKAAAQRLSAGDYEKEDAKEEQTEDDVDEQAPLLFRAV